MRFQYVLFLFSLLISSVGISQSVGWAHATGGSSSAASQDLYLHNDQFLYNLGYFTGTVDFDPGPNLVELTSTGSVSLFIQKLDTAGNLIWAKSVLGNDMVRCGRITVDNTGMIYVTGRFNGTADFDPNIGQNNITSLGGYDGFVMKMDDLGNLIWVNAIGGTDTESSPDIVCGDGVLYVSGEFENTIDFDPSPAVFNLTPNGGADLYIQKLDLNGNLIWAYNYGSSIYDDKLNESTIDSDGNVILVGSRSTYYTNNRNILIYKVDPNGNTLLNQTLGGSAVDEAWGVITDEDNNIYTTGSIRSTSVDMDLGPNLAVIGSTGGSDIYVNKMDSNGNYIWAFALNGPLGSGADEIILDDHGFLHISGFFNDSVDFDPTPGQNFSYSAVGSDHFIVRIDTAGNVLWHGVLEGGTLNGDHISGMATDQNDGLYFAGLFSYTMDVDLSQGVNNLVGSSTSGNSFVVKINQDPCMSFAVVIDSAANATCTQNAIAVCHAIYSNSPVNYTWNTTPVTNDSVAYFDDFGIFEITAVNDSGCVSQRAVSISGPGSPSGFDLTSQLIATPFRVGFPSTVWVDAYNDGCTPTTGSLSIVIDTTLINLISAYPPPNSINGDTLSYDFTDLAYDSLHVTPTLLFTTSLSASIGDTVCFDVIVDPILGDVIDSNNIKTYCYPVVNAYDPNDKNVYPQGECAEKFVKHDQMLTYTVRFQNTGNSEAINIYILDTISASLDISSLRVVAQSHNNLITEILPNNVIKFRFDNILLPDSSSNEPLSHGYVVFEIEQNSGLENETLIENTVDIFFDFNPPVRTNTVFNHVQYCDSTILSISVNTSTLCLGDQLIGNAVSSASCLEAIWTMDTNSIYSTNFDFIADTVGVFSLSVSNSSGICSTDSSFTISISDTSYNYQSFTICYGDSVFANGTYQTLTGLYIDSNLNISSCDSTVVVDLTVLPPVVGMETITACDSFTWINGVTYTSSISSISHTIAGGATSGCDSTSILNLTILSPSTGTDVIESCDPITWIDGVTYYSDTITPPFMITGGATSGCDSLSVLDLTILPVSTGTDVIESCDPITWIDGVTYYSDTITPPFMITGGASSGCDSTATLDFTILTGPNTQVTQDVTELVADQNGATYQWIDCNSGNTIIPGENNQLFTPTSNGSYAVIINYNGCSDTSGCYTVSSIGLTEITSELVVEIAPNPTTGKISIDLKESYTSFAVVVKNMLGQTVSTDYFENTNEAHLSIDSENGMYFVSIVFEDQTEYHFNILKVLE